MKILKYAATVWKETEGYVSKCPELGVTSCGDSFEEALNNLKEAVEDAKVSIERIVYMLGKSET